MSAPEIVALDLLDPAAVDLAEQWVGVYAADQRHLFGDDGSPWQLAEIQGFHRFDSKRRRAWAAVEADRVVGSGELIETVLDNLDSATVWIATLPDHRGRGVGSALLATAESAGIECGRTIFVADTETAVGASDTAASFATRHGYAVAQRTLRSRLSLPGDLELLEALRDGAGAASGGGAGGDGAAYRVESVVGLPPQEWLEGLAEMQRRMSTDVPLGDLALEEEEWDASRVRLMHTTMIEAGRQLVTSVALDRAGRIVGFTELSVSGGTPELAYQGSTLVLTEHRGHRLGLRLKAATALVVVEELPEVGSIRTWNADDNTAMLAVNRELGFVVDAGEQTWQKRVPTG